MSPATAVALLSTKPKTPRSRAFEVAMTPDRVRVAQIRRIAVAHMRLWAVPTPMAEEARLVVSELVTNAIEHGRGAVLLRMRHTDDKLRIEVTDENPAHAQLQEADREDLCGRGLFLVASLADVWGVSGNGRTTWAAFSLARGTG
ncbi:ATP-binding protein [Streptomyces sp. NPDC012623]|uniref:ATP-binding protein n=1 Tax=unclassified Streptomyces TaxID=2593676 RepID=UPI0036763A7A